MGKKGNKFCRDSSRVAFDLKHRATIHYNISKYDTSVAAGKLRYSDLDAAKSAAASVKRHVIANLAQYIEIFEQAAIKNGIEVLWATDENEAVAHIENLLVRFKVKKVVKSKSMTSEEIHFNEVFSKKGVECIETDLGEFIVQKAGEKPYHILTPAMHKSRADVAKLFHKLYNSPEEATAAEMTKMVRGILRKEFESAEMGFTGANFLLAREGAVALTENEGNGLFSVSFPKVHVVLVGIERIIPSSDYLDLFWPLLALHGTGQRVTAYNSILSGSVGKNEKDGPQKMVVILMDNGRTQLYQKEYQSEALSCIRCGACLNACPIYKNVGGYTYNAVYSGPIGAVITPHLKGVKEYGHLSFASSLCGKCYEVCPVKINLPELLLRNRKEFIEKGYQPMVEKAVISVVSKSLQSSFLMDLSGNSAKSFILNVALKKKFGEKRVVPHFSELSFRSQWKKSRKKQ
jgi:L-lactate dehydrogenase complex protein LldF